MMQFVESTHGGVSGRRGGTRWHSRITVIPAIVAHSSRLRCSRPPRPGHRRTDYRGLRRRLPVTADFGQRSSRRRKRRAPSAGRRRRSVGQPPGRAGRSINSPLFPGDTAADRLRPASRRCSSCRRLRRSAIDRRSRDEVTFLAHAGSGRRGVQPINTVLQLAEGRDPVSQHAQARRRREVSDRHSGGVGLPARRR